MHKEREPWKLDNELAAKWTECGIHVFPYLQDEEDGKIRKRVYGGSVILSDEAFYNLTNKACTAMGECDEMADLKADTSELVEVCKIVDRCWKDMSTETYQRFIAAIARAES